MLVKTNVSLKDYSTMRLGGTAKALCHITSKEELLEAVSWADERHLPHIVLGGGSNIIFTKDYNGLVIVNRISGFDVLHQDEHGAAIRIGAGENWDSAVARTIGMGLHGLEFLSAIPGTAGGTPVQNVGAYGAMISQTLVELEAYDLNTRQFVILSNEDCGFRYRSSIFKDPAARHHIIVNITVALNYENPQPPFYESLEEYFMLNSITEFTPKVIRDAVVAIRAKKLPDPSIVANSGSFFKNPIIDAEQAAALLKKFPDMRQWPTRSGQVKVAAGWLIEKAGLRGYANHGMRTYEHHALVLINDSAKDYRDMAAFTQEIIRAVQKKFGVTLEQEPELL